MEAGLYKGIVESQGWARSNGGNLYFFLMFAVNEGLEGQDVVDAQARVDLFVTEKTIERTKRALKALGAPQDLSQGIDLSWFHPDNPEHHSFVGQEITVRATAKENGYMNWDLVVAGGGGRGPQTVPLDECKGMMIGAGFKPAAAKTAPKAAAGSGRPF